MLQFSKPLVQNKILIVDLFSLLFRSFHALKNVELHDSQGEPINAVFGFIQSFLNIWVLFRPSHIVFASDTQQELFRNKLYPQYKKNRTSTPTELKIQIPKIKLFLNSGNFLVLEEPSFEADDIIATIVNNICSQHNDSKTLQYVMIFSPDKDLLPLLQYDFVKIYKPSTGKKQTFSRLDIQHIQQQFGILPKQLIDLFSLTGDQVDNIPGVPGIGLKTAISLLQQYQTLDNIYQNIPFVFPISFRTKLIAGKKLAFLSRQLIQLQSNIPIQKNWMDLSKIPMQTSNKIKQLLQTWNFQKLLQHPVILHPPKPNAITLQ